MLLGVTLNNQAPVRSQISSSNDTESSFELLKVHLVENFPCVTDVEILGGDLHGYINGYNRASIISITVLSN